MNQHAAADGPTSARWTHLALRVVDIDATVAWYERYTPLRVLERRSDDDGFNAWLAHPEAAANPFVLVIVQFLPAKDPFAGLSTDVLNPFSHIGIELPERDGVDAMAARGEADGCLAMGPVELPLPVGYVCMLRDPDGNMVEFSHDQGVYATAHDKWGRPGDA